MEGFHPLEAPFLRSISSRLVGAHRARACAFSFVRPVNDPSIGQPCAANENAVRVEARATAAAFWQQVQSR